MGKLNGFLVQDKDISHSIPRLASKVFFQARAASNAEKVGTPTMCVRRRPDPLMAR
jgi:hypothetical protein